MDEEAAAQLTGDSIAAEPSPDTMQRIAGGLLAIGGLLVTAGLVDLIGDIDRDAAEDFLDYIFGDVLVTVLVCAVGGTRRRRKRSRSGSPLPATDRQHVSASRRSLRA